MWRHAAADYRCPGCRFVAGHESPRNTKQDIVFADAAVVTKRIAIAIRHSYGRARR